MKLKSIIDTLGFEVKAGEKFLDREIHNGYASDLLSDVLAHAHKGDIWITLQTHLNIVAVASSKELAGIIIVNGRNPDGDTLKKAEEEKIPILSTKLSTYKVIGKLYEIGVR